MLSFPADPPAFFGPLPVKLQTSLSGLATFFEPEGVALLRSGEREQRLRLDIGNNAIYHGEATNYIYDDSEVQNLRLGEVYGRSWGQWGWQASLVQRTGGVLDPAIGFWHQNVVPFADPVFSTIRNGQVRTEIRQGEATLASRGSAAALTSVTLTAKRRLASGVALRGLVKLPVGGRRSWLDNGAVDIGVGLVGQTLVAPRWALHGNLSAVRAGTTQGAGFTSGVRWLTGSVLAVEYQVGERTRLVVQGEDTSFPYARTLRGGSGRRQQMSFGAWYQESERTAWHASFSENIYPFRVTSYTPDIMVSLGVVRRS